MLLTVLAASALDDPHALDRGSSTATAVLRLLGHELPNSAEAWRMAWDEHGIDCDPVSSRVLVLNLPIAGDAPCVQLALAAGPEPLWLTLRSLTGSFQLASGAAIHVRADDDAAGHAIVAAVRSVIPDAELWRFETRPATQPRYEEQDLPLLLHDLRRTHT
jgi:uncharacterized protein DUF3323